MSEVTGIATVWLPVNDVAASVGFYRDRLSVSVKDQQDDWAELELDGTMIGLNGREDPSGDGGAVLAFKVDTGLEQAVEDLSGQGVEFTGEISDHPWGRIAPFKDPDGNDLQLFEPPSN